MKKNDNNKTSVEIVLPVYNEEKELKKNVAELIKFLKSSAEFSWHVTIADNASTDKTSRIGKSLQDRYLRASYHRLDKKGRGRAVKQIWNNSRADQLFYMDIDLSTDLKHLPKMVEALSNSVDIAIGSRLLSQSKVKNRTLKREFISRGYNLLVKLFFQTNFSDAQCGFKGITKQTAEKLLPHIKDNEWFMDSELLILGEKAGCNIHEEPVTWTDNPGSTVRVLSTAWGDFKGLIRLFLTRPWRKLQHE